MVNVFIAVGGSGTKVAEALVRLLAAGFPTKLVNQQVPTSAGEEMQIWLLDPDRNSGAAQSLQKSVDDYHDLQKALSDGTTASRWAMEIDPIVRHLDPLQLPGRNTSDQVKTLRGILNSQELGQTDSTPFLDLFYLPKELDIEVDRGFYQKPFIGAPVMAVFARQLRDPNSPGGRQCQLINLTHHPVRFFLCGSLHGGTGACGVPVMGKFLGDLKRANPQLDWHLGGCLLAPYCVPPAPPFGELKDGQQISREMVDGLARQYAQVAPFSYLPTDQGKRQLVTQILLGFYARPDDLTSRARQSLVYYKDHIAPYLSALYLVGKPTPDQLEQWSNGGASQRNPLNSAEVVAALAALNFFSGAHDRNVARQSYFIGSATRSLGAGMFLRDLPQHTLPFNGGMVPVDAEKVFFATAAMRHLVRHQFPWHIPAANWPKDFRLKNYYLAHPEREESDRSNYEQALSLIADSITSLICPQPGMTMGWDGHDYTQLSPLLSDDPTTVSDITEQIKRRLLSNEPKGELSLGQSTIKVSDQEFSGWCPEGTEFTRGDYLRHVWLRLFKKALDANRRG